MRQRRIAFLNTSTIQYIASLHTYLNTTACWSFAECLAGPSADLERVAQ